MENYIKEILNEIHENDENVDLESFKRRDTDFIDILFEGYRHLCKWFILCKPDSHVGSESIAEVQTDNGTIHIVPFWIKHIVNL